MLGVLSRGRSISLRRSGTALDKDWRSYERDLGFQSSAAEPSRCLFLDAPNPKCTRICQYVEQDMIPMDPNSVADRVSLPTGGLYVHWDPRCIFGHILHASLAWESLDDGEG